MTRISVLALTLLLVGFVSAKQSAASCSPMGWFPSTFGLLDHTVFEYQGYYYLASIYLGTDHYEDLFAYARSRDLCNWEELAPILTERIPGASDEFKIWAPFVYVEDETYYMYYTGVTHNFTQRIMLATSTNPADPASWRPQGMVFQPDHPNMLWQDDAWADCRDPTVTRVGNTYYLYYSARDLAGGIIGLATASSLSDPWRDWGAILTLTDPDAMPESATIITHGGLYYLFYNEAGQGERYRIGASPAGPWTKASVWFPGWAHEIWKGPNGYEYTSFLTTHTVTMSILSWDTLYDPARPFIGEAVYHFWLPFITR